MYVWQVFDGEKFLYFVKHGNFKDTLSPEKSYVDGNKSDTKLSGEVERCYTWKY
jgi:hypothetical protein